MAVMIIATAIARKMMKMKNLSNIVRCRVWIY